jgi:hypothetical protein
MAKRDTTFLLKRSNVAGKVPSNGDLVLGEMALNTADVILYTSGTTANTILPIGWDRIHRTGDTMTGNFIINGNISITGDSIFNNITATTISNVDYIDFNTGTTIPQNVGRLFFHNDSSSLSYYTNDDININIGQQLYSKVFNNTGSLLSKGSVVKIESSTNGIPNVKLTISSGKTNNEIAGLIASDIPNGESGFIINNGILSGLTITSHTIGDVIYLSDTILGEYVNSTSTLKYSSRTNEIGYIISTGITTGSIYVNINNEDNNLTLTDKERNILEGNTISTGIYEFTGLTKTSNTTFNIAPARGWIVDNTYENATLPAVTNVYYSGGTGLTTPYLNTDVATYVLITSASTVTLQPTFPTPQERRENIFLGRIAHPDKTNIVTVNNTTDFDVSPMSAIRDLWTSIKLINEGVVISSNGANLSFNSSSGTLWGNGIGWYTNQLNPDSISISGSSPVTFQYRTQTGGTYSNTTTIDPAYYDVGGVRTLVGGGSNSSTNQRVYLFPNNQIRVQYGQTVYSSLSQAVTASQTETFTTFSNNRDNAILIGIISVNKSATDLSNPSQAVFSFVSKFGEILGGTGGLSTTTLQQAYNNSSTPEIVINSTLDGLSIKNGTGNADNVTNLIEGVNSSNVRTSFTRADGYISGLTLDATNILSGGTNLNDIFQPIGGGPSGSVLKGFANIDFGDESDYAVLTVTSSTITQANINAVSFVFSGTSETSLDDFTLNGVSFNIENIIDGVSFDIRGSAIIFIIKNNYGNKNINR